MKTLCKFVQRQAYTILSYKYGTTLFFLGIILVVVSAFQFGETVMDWSHRQYITVFSTFTDNVAGLSFRHRLCSPVPIDVVYTWVNGSDPELISKLHRVRMDLQDELNESSIETCTFSHCVPAKLIVIDPKFSSELPLEELRKKYTMFANAVDIYALNFTGENHKFTVLSYSNEAAVLTALDNKIPVKEKNMSINRAYYTSDWTLQQGVLLSDTIIMSGIPHKHGMKNVKSHFPEKYQNVFSKIDVFEDQGIAILYVTAKEDFEDVLQLNMTIDDKVISFAAANLAWDLNDYSRDEDISASRFEDNEELRYSLRSIEKYAPWVRHIFIVTNGQIPSWLNLENPRLTLVTHEEIFLNKSHLPTFSSPAIEANLHRIPGISDKFIYLNDDVMFGKEVWPDDFYSHSTGQKVYLTWPTPNCAENCPAMWIKDGYCDKTCNNSRCDWDGGDCEGQQAQSPHGQIANLWPGEINFQTSLQNMYCSTGCANSWLADRYCDQSCNVLSCGFDIGDCGVEHYNKLYRVDLQPAQTVYIIPPGENIVYFNLTTIMNTMGFIKTALMDNEEIVRKAAVSQKFNVMTVLLYLNRTTTTLSCNFTLQKKHSNETTQMHFNFTVNTKLPKILRNVTRTPRKPKNIKTTKTPSATKTENIIITVQLPAALLHPHPKNSSFIEVGKAANFSLYNLSKNIQAKRESLIQRLTQGELTEKGFKIREYQLWLQLLKSNHSVIEPKVKQVSKLRSLGETIALDAVHKRLIQKPNIHIVKSEDVGQKKDTDGPSQGRRLLSMSQIPFQPNLFPWEKSGPLVELQVKLDALKSLGKYQVESHKQRKLLDTFADSILNVNRLYNKKFGYITRKVPAHMPHMIDKNIMTELQNLFPEQWDITSSHRIRSSNDMQFAFAYFYYLIGVTVNVTAAHVFDEMDTDKSGVLSDREIRTLATRLFELPLDLVTLLKLETMFINCSIALSSSSPERQTEPSRRSTEKYYETGMPQVTRDFFINCPEIQQTIQKSFKPKPKYKHMASGDSEVAFKMVKTNISAVVSQLDDIRKHPKKFVCLNDNIDHTKEEAQTVKAILNDFFESMYPMRSHFELEREYRNRFLHLADLQDWKKYRNWLRFWTYLMLAILAVLALISFCSDRIESAHRRIFPHRRPRIDKNPSNVLTTVSDEKPSKPHIPIEETPQSPV